MVLANGFGGDVVPNSASSGDLTATGSVPIAAAGKQSVGTRISNSFVATVVFEGSVDQGVNYDSIAVWDVTNGRWVTSTTAAGDFIFADVAGFTHVRARVSAFTSGTVTIAHQAVAAASRRNQAQAAPGQAAPPEVLATGSTDGTTTRADVALAAIPTGSEYAKLVRPIVDVRTTAVSLGALDATAVIALAGRNGVGFLLSGTWAGTVVVEGSSDGGTTYSATTQPILNTITGALVASIISTNGTFLVPNVAGFTHVRLKMSSYTSGTATGTLSASTSAGSPSRKRQTYVYRFSSLAAPAGVFLAVNGSATRTVRVKQVFLNKPSANVTITAKKHSSAFTGGTSSNATATPRDSSNTTASIVVAKYTAGPSGGGTEVGDGLAEVDLTTTETMTLNFGGGDEAEDLQEIVLRGTSEVFSLSASGAATLDGFVVVTEE